LPYVVLVLGVLAALWFIHRWMKKKKPAQDTPGQAPIQAQVPSDLLRAGVEQPDLEDESARAQLLRECARLRSELTDLDFDFQSGKLSDSDYSGLKQVIETKAAGVIQQLSTLPAEPAPKPRPAAKSAASPSFRRWQIVAGGAFLMFFGLALGVFLTGTTPASDAARAALNEGKQALGKQDFPKAIDAFKKVLDADPNNPEAHTYMGYILIQAGHGDGALMAFDKALSQAPNFPMALWGKGMVLYQEKKDFAGAREVLERLLNLVPPGEERNEVVKVLADIPTTGGTPGRSTGGDKSTAAASSSSAQIGGKITIDPKLKANVDSQATLFIIARPANAAKGPPMAVKKIHYPVFPLSYSLGPENVMMQGIPFTGSVAVIARLDKDGNPTTRQSGDLTGDYKKIPWRWVRRISILCSTRLSSKHRS
jgi:tetratricopeptide (TPR) repeat protein